ncbi:MAG: 30S ribosomal protein S9 [Candidatus Aminicenantes bacterium ADurb.Bin508]|nr:MAG: 30S ribosomal protein S9 [Candidatus Aminicenantes bacterium ADurb.Bin508]HNX41597.1 30S ribosomal protein S9 [Candidatus Aminicenantes bacterium]HPS99817.1 30S ribosomal protein S9 [Candidatus Aminicenantes bacterium]
MIQYYGTGRRKTSIARVYLRPGNGKIDVVVNHKRRELDAYFTLEYWKSVIKKPLLTTETVDKFDAIVFLTGGGISAQADAVRLGLARALQSYNPELREALKKEGMLSRDSREKERRKYGLHKARKAPQYHKR